MKKLIFFITLGGLMSCAPLKLTVLDSKSKTVEIEPEQNFEIYKQPRIYLNSQDEFINLKEINRGTLVLNLSDQIIFSNKKEKDSVKKNLQPLQSFKEEDKIKLKIFSSCAYTKKPLAKRSFQELGSRFYYWSFSIFELIPKEVLLNGLNKNLYCTFTFGFEDRDNKGVFNWFNMIQQLVRPFFNENLEHKLSLVRKTKSGSYLPLNRVITHNNINNIFLLNRTVPAHSYDLYCKSLKPIKFSGFKANGLPVFLSFINDYRGQQKGVLQCRFFSKSDNKITGMTNSFELDFNHLNYEKSPLPFKEMFKNLVVKSKPKVGRHGRSVKYSRRYKDGGNVPLNSYFYFKNLNTLTHSIKYHDIEIKVKTQCFNKKILGSGKSLIVEYIFPFRQKFPIMAVTPPKLFLLHNSVKNHDLWLKFINDYNEKKYYNAKLIRQINETRKSYPKSHCNYKITLQDKQSEDQVVESIERTYFIVWTKDSYGIDNDPLNIFVSKYVKLPREPRNTHYSDVRQYVGKNNYNGWTTKIEKPFFSLPDIHSNKAGYLTLDFLDILGDNFFQREGSSLSHNMLRCHSQTSNTNGKTRAKYFYRSYSVQNNPISVKSVFSASKIVNYIKRDDIVFCRILFYENQLLRYFSQEMVISFKGR